MNKIKLKAIEATRYLASYIYDHISQPSVVAQCPLNHTLAGIAQTLIDSAKIFASEQDLEGLSQDEHLSNLIVELLELIVVMSN